MQPGSSRDGPTTSRNAAATASSWPSLAWKRAKMNSSMTASLPRSALDSKRRSAALVQHRETALMPDRVGRRHVACRLERRDLVRGEAPSDGADILDELLLVARPDDDAGDGRPLKQPV